MVRVVGGEVGQHIGRILLCRSLLIPEQIYKRLDGAGSNNFSLIVNIGDGEIPQGGRSCYAGASLIFAQHADQAFNGTCLRDGNLISRMIYGEAAQRSTSCNTHPRHTVVKKSNEQWYRAGACDDSLVVRVASGEAP